VNCASLTAPNRTLPTTHARRLTTAFYTMLWNLPNLNFISQSASETKDGFQKWGPDPRLEMNLISGVWCLISVQ